MTADLKHHFAPQVAADEPPVRFHPAVFVGFLLLCLAVNYPGRLNEDSLEQLLGAANRAYLSDLHSPIVTWLWSLPTPLTGQPAGALLVNSLLLSLYGAVVPARLPRDARGIAALAIETVFKLSLAAFAGAIVKDIILLGLLVSALAAWQLSRTSGNPRHFGYACVALLALSLMVRPTNFVMVAVAAALVLPIAVRSIRSYLLLVAGAALLLALSVPVYMSVSRWVLGAHSGHAETQLFLFDAAGISVATGTDQFARLPGWPAQGLPPPADCFTPRQAATMTPWGRCTNYWLAQEEVVSRHGRHRIGLWWLGTVAGHPIAYLRHRAAFAAYLLDSRGPPHRRGVWRLRVSQVTARPFMALNGVTRAGDFARAAAGRAEASQLQWWRPNHAQLTYLTLSLSIYAHRRTDVVALAACLLVVCVSWRRRYQGKPVLFSAAMAAGLGIGNVAMHFLLGVASQQRYLFPTLVCAIFAIIALLRANESPERRRVEPAAGERGAGLFKSQPLC